MHAFMHMNQIQHFRFADTEVKLEMGEKFQSYLSNAPNEINVSELTCKEKEARYSTKPYTVLQRTILPQAMKEQLY